MSRRTFAEALGSNRLTVMLSGFFLVLGAAALGRAEGSQWEWGGLLGRMSDEHARQTGLGMWLFGAFFILNAAVLRRDGRITHTMQVIAAASGTFLTIYKVVPGAVDDGAGKVILYVVTALLFLIGLLGAMPPRPPSAAELFRDLAAEVREAARPERPADPAAAIARIQASIAADIDDLRAHAPGESDQMRRLLDRYRSDHGTDTVETSTRPLAVRIAADTLVEDFQDLYLRLADRTDPTARPYAVSALVNSRVMADLVCDRTR
jgi:hypothetical protein